MATAVRPVPRSTETGEYWSVLFPPSPTCPKKSYPQHFRSPLSRIAHVCLPPPEIAIAVRPEPRSTAVDKGALVFVMFPPYPKKPVPQHFNSPLSRMAQTVALEPLPEPADTATAVRPVPRLIELDEGVHWCLELLPPSPNCP